MSITIRKIILWLSVIVIAIILLFFWGKNLPARLGSFRGGEFIEKLNLPKIEIPKMPAINIQELKKLYGEKATTTAE
jgi:hypothetical protein